MVDRCVEGLESLPAAARSCVLTIGNFDGVHRGHRRILATSAELGQAERAPVVAMTFEPPPDLVLRPGDAPLRVVPPEVKYRLLREAQADWVVVARADRALLGLTAAEFIEQVIVRRFAPRHVVEGANFLFGRGRTGDVDTLRAAGEAAGFAVHVAEPVRAELPEGPRAVSSTLIRGLVSAGRVADAALCLGRDYALYGRVVTGEGMGGLLGFPTANLSPGEQVCPGDGVYAGRAAVAGRTYAAAISVGTRPTFSDGRAAGRSVEAFLLNAEGDFYDEEMVLSLACRLRDQERFDSAEALKDQMERDVRRVREICEDRGAP